MADTGLKSEDSVAFGVGGGTVHAVGRSKAWCWEYCLGSGDPLGEVADMAGDM